MFESPPLASLQSALADPTNPIGMRMRAAYFLRQAYDNFTKNNSVVDDDTQQSYDFNDGEETKRTAGADISLVVIQTLSNSLEDVRHGALLRHEFAYVMGQLRDERSIPALEKILLDESDDIMVRHECGEALGAIGSSGSIATLEMCARDKSIEVGQTCQLALDFIRWKINGGGDGDEHAPIACACMISPYSSVDPAPPHPKHEGLSTAEIGSILKDESMPLFERFRAMFSLRNRGGKEVVQELGNALVQDDSSALLRHEVAYVLGQLQHSDGVEFLETSLKRENEHRMVRHESAEALGAIEERWGECELILEQFLDDRDDVVRESCAVALDAADYWGFANPSGVEESASEEMENIRTNFSLYKAETNGLKTKAGVLMNHFNIAK
jgi:deoxyhypusine monooxygenase